MLVPQAGCEAFISSPLGSGIIAGIGGLLGGSSDDGSCGTDELAALVPDCPAGLVCFTTACDSHNHCYAACGIPKAVCDIRFFQDMVLICTASFSEGDPRLARCRRLAFTYWRAVDQFGQEAFEATCPIRESGSGEPVQVGACCTPASPPVCTDLVTPVECRNDRGVFFGGLECDLVNSTFGGCPTPPNDDCRQADVLCPDSAADPDLGVCAGDVDTDAGGGVCSVSVQDCPNDMLCLPHDADAYRCTIGTDNRLATTDADGANDLCLSGSHQADVWYRYIAPCTGTLTIRMCDEPSYDSVLAVYGSQTPDGLCACPLDPGESLDCDDDSCGGFGTVSAITIDNAIQGACYTIAVGGWSTDDTEATAARGVSELSIGMLCDQTATPARIGNVGKR